MKKASRILLFLLALTPLPAFALGEYGTQHTPEQQVVLDEALKSYQTHLDSLAETHKSQVRTLSNGVQVKRTPDTCDTYTAGYTYLTENFTYNHRYLKADQRGCTACHTDLAALVENMRDYPHVPMGDKDFYVQTTTRTCIECHDFSGEPFDEYFGGFGSLMHSIHTSNTFNAMGGNCWSCHYATGDGGELQLWDDVKHDVLRGITDLDASTVPYTFEWNQEKTLNADQLFDINWHYMEGFLHRNLSGKLDLVPDPTTDGVYDQWKISIDGKVEKPTTLSISEMIDLFSVKQDKLTINCGVNKCGGYIGNFDIEGINVLDLLEYAGVSEDATHLEITSADGSMFVSRIDDIKKYGGYLTLNVGGKPIPYHQGYPVTFWVGADAAWKNIKEATHIQVVTVENEEEVYPIYQYVVGYLTNVDGDQVFKPSCGIVGLTEGQIIPYDQPLVIEGYAHGFDDDIVAVEFSFDRGQTWITCETPGYNAARWAYWYFTWTPPAKGAYTVSARAVTDKGEKTFMPTEILLNAE